MKNNTPTKSNRPLWWISIIALGISAATACFLQPNDLDETAKNLRILLPTIGVLIAGTCLIIGTADRWFR